MLALLWRAQEQNGYWLPRAAIEKVATMLDMPNIRVLEVATFYTMFNLAPVGRYYVQVCGTTPCMLRGADDIKAVCRKRIGEQGHVTAGRPVLLDRGRMPRRLLQCADGPDQRRLLRGPDAGELRQASRRSCGGPAGQDRLADRPGLVGAGRRPDRADDALRRRRSWRAEGVDAGDRRAPRARKPQYEPLPTEKIGD